MVAIDFRTYINPFVHFIDQRRWRCNVCYRVNERKSGKCVYRSCSLFLPSVIIFLVPEEFLYDPVSKTYGDPSRRPECKVGMLKWHGLQSLQTFSFQSATIEFIAPSEYMLRPPQVRNYHTMMTCCTINKLLAREKLPKKYQT